MKKKYAQVCDVKVFKLFLFFFYQRQNLERLCEVKYVLGAKF